MSSRNFRALLEAQWAQRNFVCVGLDSELAKIPTCVHGTSDEERMKSFNRLIVDQTHDLVCAYKPNSAFYEALGAVGWRVLQWTIEYIHEIAPSVVVILDAKRGDIGNTNAGYVTAAFDVLGADAITVHPYFGETALRPFLNRVDKGIIVLCRTSNPGAGEFQDFGIHVSGEEAEHLQKADAVTGWNVTGGCTARLFAHVAYQVVRHWNKNGNCGLVVGATYPDELRMVRAIVGDMPLLIPGIGKQGGDLEKTVAAGKDSRGRGIIINSSSGIIFASNSVDFPEIARQETKKLRDAINQHREKME